MAAPVLRLLRLVDGVPRGVPIFADDLAELLDLIPAPPPIVERRTRPGELEIPVGRWLRITLLADEDGEVVVRRDADGLDVLIVAVWPCDDRGMVIADRIRRGVVDVVPVRLDPADTAILHSIAARFPPSGHDYRIRMEAGSLRVRPCGETLGQVPGIDLRRQGDRVRDRVRREK